MVTYTTTYSFAKPTVGDDEDAWGGYLNGNFDTLESLLKGTTALTAIDVTGNITVGGTVDGRDIAVNIPASLGTAGQVLTVNSGATAAEWADAGGGNTFDTSIIFEGATADAFETTLTVTDPTADRTFTLPDATGTAAIIDAAGVLENESHTATLKLNSTNSGESRVEIKSRQFGSFGADLWDFEIDPSDTAANTVMYFNVDGDNIFNISNISERLFSVANIEIITGGVLRFEGSTNDAFETTLTVDDPTADNTITLPDASGTVPLIDSSGHLIVENADPELQLISTDASESYFKVRKNFVTDAWDIQIDGSNSASGSFFSTTIDGVVFQEQNVVSSLADTTFKDTVTIEPNDIVNGNGSLQINSGFLGEGKIVLNSNNPKIGIGTTSPAVSLDIATTDAIQVPDGTTAQRPSSPANGMFRYSTTDNQFEGYINGSWGAVGGGGGGDDDAVSVTKSGSTYTLDLSAGHNFYTAADVATDTFALSNIPTTSFEGAVEVQYLGGTITWPTEFEWANGVAPSLKSVRDHLIEFKKIRSSSKIKAYYNGDFPFTGTTTFPTFVGYASATTGNGGNVTIDLTSLAGGSDTSPSENDLVIVSAACEAISYPSISTSGYTALTSTYANDSYDVRATTRYKVMGATPDTSISVTGSGDANGATAAMAFVFRGIDTTTPINNHFYKHNQLNSVIPSFNNVTSGATSPKLIVCPFQSAHTIATSIEFTDVGGYFNDFHYITGNDSGDITVGMGYTFVYGASTTFSPAPDGISLTAGSDSTLYSAASLSILVNGA